MYCTNCGNKITGNLKFCPECGTRLDSGVAPAQSAVQEPAAQAEQPLETEDWSVPAEGPQPSMYGESETAVGKTSGAWSADTGFVQAEPQPLMYQETQTMTEATSGTWSVAEGMIQGAPQPQQQSYEQQPQPYAPSLQYEQPQQYAQPQMTASPRRKRRVQRQRPASGNNRRTARQTSAGLPVTILCFAIAAVHLIQLILWFVPAIRFKASALGARLSESHSMHGFLENLMVISIIAIILLLAAIALNVVYGILKPMKLTTVIGIITTVWYFAWLMITKAVNASEAKDLGLSESAVRFTFAGNLMIVLSVIVLILYIVRPVLRRMAK